MRSYQTKYNKEKPLRNKKVPIFDLIFYSANDSIRYMETYTPSPRSIRYHINKYLHRNKERFVNKTVVDLPAGKGILTKTLLEIGAIPVPLDLFPETFEVTGVTCKKADVEAIPLEDRSVDYAICQEGIEHFSDQSKAFREFNRILKDNGSLIITTPNHSNLRSKVSYLLGESERFGSYMAPNEIDSIWMDTKHQTNEIYFGHIFLIGIQKLRVLAKLAGFRIKHIQFTRIKTTSLLLLIMLYPLFSYQMHIPIKRISEKKEG
jgi:SAM-dependent methyltransferase